LFCANSAVNPLLLICFSALIRRKAFEVLRLQLQRQYLAVSSMKQFPSATPSPYVSRLALPTLLADSNSVSEQTAITVV